MIHFPFVLQCLRWLWKTNSGFLMTISQRLLDSATDAQAKKNGLFKETEEALHHISHHK